MVLFYLWSLFLSDVNQRHGYQVKQKLNVQLNWLQKDFIYMYVCMYIIYIVYLIYYHVYYIYIYYL